MLPQKTYIYNPVSIGSGDYTFNLYFLDFAQAKFLNLGDYVEDTAGNRYEIKSPTGIPFTDGNLVTAHFADNDVLPVEDVDYNSYTYTPDQVDYRATMRTAGFLDSPALYSAHDYEYEVTSSWTTPSEESKAEIGDSIVDAAGKEYRLTYVDPVNRFAAPIRIQEVHRVGVMPTIGLASHRAVMVSIGTNSDSGLALSSFR